MSGSWSKLQKAVLALVVLTLVWSSGATRVDASVGPGIELTRTRQPEVFLAAPETTPKTVASPRQDKTGPALAVQPALAARPNCRPAAPAPVRRLATLPRTTLVETIELRI